MNNNRKRLLVSGCKRNPRKIKRILNLVYFIILGLPEDTNLGQKVDLVISWCVLASSFPKLAKKVKDDPSLFFWTSFACCLFKDLPTLISSTATNLGYEIRTKVNVKDNEIWGTILDDNVKEQLKSIAESGDDELFQFLSVFGQNHGLDSDWNEKGEKLAKYVSSQESYLQEIIRHGGFTGI